jgi:serine/threonine-protein kinase RsbT
MAVSVSASQSLSIRSEDDIILVRKRVRELAEAQRFDSFATAALTTATSELARNAYVHAGGGEATIEEIADGARAGIRVVFRDQGPGIPDVARVMAGGFSTARSLGLGLSGSRRLVDDFSIDTSAGNGTCIAIVKWKRF